MNSEMAAHLAIMKAAIAKDQAERKRLAARRPVVVGPDRFEQRRQVNIIQRETP